jgi:DNA-binding HxlR family transcriptional regulator
MSIIQNKEISIGARLLYIYLEENKNTNNEVRNKGTRLMGDEIGASYQVVIRYLKELEEQELIKRTTIAQNKPQIIELI